MDSETNDDQEYRESFGDFLRRHREASGKTIDGISRTTRIPRRYLEAFELNDQTKLPEDAFARGFLRSFAQEIGLDIEDSLHRYERFRRSLMPTQIKEIKKPAKHILLGETAEPAQVQRWLIWVLGGGAGLTVLILGVIWLLQPSNPSKETPPPIETTVSSNEVKEDPAAGVAPAAPIAVAKPAPSLVLPATPSVLTIKALRDAKLSIRLDENAVQDVSMKANESQTLNVFREVEIRTTDKTALQFQYNGKPLEVAGPVLKLFNRNLFDKKR